MAATRGPQRPDDVAQRLQRAMDALGMKQAQLVKLTGINQSTLSSILTGRRKGAGLTLEQGRRIALALRVPVDWLCGLWRDDPEMPCPLSLEFRAGPGGWHSLFELAALMVVKHLTDRAEHTQRIADDARITSAQTSDAAAAADPGRRGGRGGGAAADDDG